MSCAYVCLESQFTLHTHSVHLSLSQVTPFLSNWLVSVGKDNLKYVCNQVLGACKAILSVSVHVWTNLVPQQSSTCIQWVHYPGFSTLDKCLHFAQTSFSTMSFAVWDTICFWKKEKQKQKQKKKQKKKCLIAWSFCWIIGSEIRYFVWPSQCWEGWPSMSVYTFISLG